MSGVTAITWSNDRGGSGSASPTVTWTVENIPLQLGQNVITVTALDAAGNSATDTLTVTYTPPPDTTPPVVTITSPVDALTYATSQATLTLGGIASDNVGVTQVVWANSRGGSGTCLGTTSWTRTGISLSAGRQCHHPHRFRRGRQYRQRQPDRYLYSDERTPPRPTWRSPFRPHLAHVQYLRR